MAKDPRTLLDNVFTYLNSTGVGTPGVSLWKQYMPDPPETDDEATVIYHTGGVADVANPTRFPTFSVQHRNTHAESALSKVTEIHSLLDDTFNLFSEFPGRLVAQAEPGAGFKDDNGLWVFSLNFRFVTTSQK